MTLFILVWQTNSQYHLHSLGSSSTATLQVPVMFAGEVGGTEFGRDVDVALVDARTPVVTTPRLEIQDATLLL